MDHELSKSKWIVFYNFACHSAQLFQCWFHALFKFDAFARFPEKDGTWRLMFFTTPIIHLSLSSRCLILYLHLHSSFNYFWFQLTITTLDNDPWPTSMVSHLNNVPQPDQSWPQRPMTTTPRPRPPMRLMQPTMSKGTFYKYIFRKPEHKVDTLERRSTWSFGKSGYDDSNVHLLAVPLSWYSNHCDHLYFFFSFSHICQDFI